MDQPTVRDDKAQPAANVDPGAGIRMGLNRGVMCFLIGLVAGIASVFLPRLMLSLAVDTQSLASASVDLFHTDFLLLGALFAVFIGIISVIFEASRQRSPQEIFMGALAIPALLSGVLNTTSATHKLQTSEQEKSQAIRALAGQAGIGQARVSGFEIIGAPAAPPASPARERGSGVSLFPSAYAQASTRPQSEPGFDPGLRITRPAYVVAIRRAKDQADALKSVAEIQRDIPTAQAIKTGEGYFVIDSATLRSEQNAAMDAVRLKGKNYNPTILNVGR